MSLAVGLQEAQGIAERDLIDLARVVGKRPRGGAQLPRLLEPLPERLRLRGIGRVLAEILLEIATGSLGERGR
jgi:hypothetical protein